jgi:ribosomal protein S18
MNSLLTMSSESKTVLYDQPGKAKKKAKMTKKQRRRLNRIKRIQLAKAIVFYTPNSGDRLTRTTVDYKNIPLLRRYISFEGKILTRRANKLSAKKQRKMTLAIKTARVAGFLPFIRR